jgi:hypothetical protein
MTHSRHAEDDSFSPLDIQVLLKFTFLTWTHSSHAETGDFDLDTFQDAETEDIDHNTFQTC